MAQFKLRTIVLSYLWGLISCPLKRLRYA